MKNRNLIFILIFLFFISSISVFAQSEFTDEDINNLIKNAPTAKEYPQAGAIVLLHQKVKNVSEDGSSIINEHLVIKILNDRGKGKFGDQKRRFDIDTDSIIVVKAQTYKHDMSIVPVEEKAINDITPPQLRNASIYSNLQQKVISFPALEPNVTMELKLQKITKAPELEMDKFYWGIETFQTDEPILFKEYALVVPEKWEPKISMQNDSLKPEITTENNLIKYVWSAKNSEQIIHEPFMPPRAAIAPRLLYTSAMTWDEIGQWFASHFYTKVTPNQEIKEYVSNLIKDSKNRDDKIREIFLYLATEIRRVHLSLGEAGYEPHEASDVFSNKYGDWRDKTVLLISMLDAAGIESYPAMVQESKISFAKNVPTPKQFNALYVMVPRKNKPPLWLNPFEEYCYYGYFPYAQGSTALVIKPESFKLVNVMDTPPEANLSDNEMILTIDPYGNVKGELKSNLLGYFDFRTRIQLKNATPKEKDQFFKKAVNGIGEGTKEISHSLSDLKDLTQTVKISQSFEAPELGVVEGDMMIFRIPDIPFWFANYPFYPALESRKYDFLADSDVILKTKVHLNLPKEYKVVYMPQKLKVENDFGTWALSLDKKGENKISYSSEILIKETHISKDKYSTFKNNFDNFVIPKNTLILLEKI